jgi:hypothetical protein
MLFSIVRAASGADNKITFPTVADRIIIEHCVNVSLSTTKTGHKTLEYHVKEQGENYLQDEFAPTQVWVIHWTTVSREDLKTAKDLPNHHPKDYYFPTSPVNIVFVITTVSLKYPSGYKR